MPLSKKNILGALFDVKPVDESGAIDVQKINRVQTHINLRPRRRAATLRVTGERGIESSPLMHITERKRSGVSVKQPPREHVEKGLERFLNSSLDIQAELARIGGGVENAQKVQYRAVLAAAPVPGGSSPTVVAPGISQSGTDESRTSESNVSFDDILAKIRERPEEPERDAERHDVIKEAQAAVDSLNAIGDAEVISYTGEVVRWVEDVKRKVVPAAVPARPHAKKKTVAWLLVAALAGFGSVYGGKYGFEVKDRLVSNGEAAVQNLTDAGDKLKSFDFSGASADFAQAYAEFSSANETLSVMGANIASVIGDLPGGGGIKSVSILLQIGTLMSDSGKSMSDALSALSQTGAALDPRHAAASLTTGVLTALKTALIASDQNLQKATVLLASLDVSSLPEDKQQAVASLNDKLPLIASVVHDSVAYSRFLEGLIGTGTKQYLLLFQNPSELRPTGGFPGSYGVLTFQDGRLKDFRVDDVYNLDGQLKEKFVPPVQLQHITPTWGMRDANWFIDFPTSARTLTDFFELESGSHVDGVITFSPRVVMDILRIVGPVQMPKYGLTLTADNFLTEIQREVEYGKNRAQPKTILVELAPVLLEKLHSADSDSWPSIVSAVVAGIGRKDILMHFKDVSLENFAVEQGFSGRVVETDDDYLMVTVSNVKGSKGDAVTDTSVSLATRVDNGQIIHTLRIARKHTGGDTVYGFYNKQNPAYVRVLVPDGSKFLSIEGNNRPGYKSIIPYDRTFTYEPALAALEASAYDVPGEGVGIYREAGKTEFGFWQITNPGKTTTVTLVYAVPQRVTGMGDTYRIIIQKQPGLEVPNFSFTLAKPPGLDIASSEPVLHSVGDLYTLNGELTRDTSVTVQFR